MATLQKTGNEIIKCENLSYWYETYEKKSGIKGTLQDLWKRKHKKSNGDKRYKCINK